MKIVRPSVALMSMTKDALQVIEYAGRTCYKSEPAGDPEKFVRGLIKRGHESVIEHASASFRIVCDRGVTHELVRHRLASYSQESTRYCNYAKDKFDGEITVIEPPGLDQVAQDTWRHAMLTVESAYMVMINAHRLPPQIARSVLPTCLKTEIVFSANFRELRHFLRLRTAPAAHPQMREIACEIGRYLVDAYPACFDDIVTPGGQPVAPSP
jgi:thymidylate synthase (FAD)